MQKSALAAIVLILRPGFPFTQAELIQIVGRRSFYYAIPYLLKENYVVREAIDKKEKKKRRKKNEAEYRAWLETFHLLGEKERKARQKQEISTYVYRISPEYQDMDDVAETQLLLRLLWKYKSNKVKKV